MPIFKNLPQIKVDKVKEKIKMDKSEKHLFTLPLQFFAEGGNGDGNEGGAPPIMQITITRTKMEMVMMEKDRKPLHKKK